ncbi:transmembrane protein, putative (macronuclear) [Tetrahymena thermophila SB210]|uniref:Transmembrane protein, putative n=1 Tax=Tetrahymena thermophila (strain SB210) TaxID=312017 RepID=I7ME05_TETTS|nr:transmembrane protein, putative [Tetrahymena thermophila SB210]EAR93788.2 transmembrane protein, putative [Tetrahymena thermophila SB210]|eukprot:XP_001014033.2 transmembrane protein, putative [Tetrahymena thermophila SB210]
MLRETFGESTHLFLLKKSETQKMPKSRCIKKIQEVYWQLLNGLSNQEGLKKIAVEDLEEEEEAPVQEVEEEAHQEIEVEEEDTLDQDLQATIHQIEKFQEEEIEAEVEVEEELEEAAEVIVEKTVEREMKKKLMGLIEEEEDLSPQRKKNPLEMTEVLRKIALAKIRSQKMEKEKTLVYLLKNKSAQKINLNQKIKTLKTKKALKLRNRLNLNNSNNNKKKLSMSELFVNFFDQNVKLTLIQTIKAKINSQNLKMIYFTFKVVFYLYFFKSLSPLYFIINLSKSAFFFLQFYLLFQNTFFNNYKSSFIHVLNIFFYENYQNDKINDIIFLNCNYNRIILSKYQYFNVSFYSIFSILQFYESNNQ